MQAAAVSVAVVAADRRPQARPVPRTPPQPQPQRPPQLPPPHLTRRSHHRSRNSAHCGTRTGRRPGGPSLETLTFAKGWGYATFNTSSVQPDNTTGLTQGIIGLANKGQVRAKPGEWGVLMAWLWGLSKELDYFETDRDEEAKQLAVDDFSRWGKTAVLAAAVEPRRIFRGSWPAISKNSWATGRR